MAKYSVKSQQKLGTCNVRIIQVMTAVIIKYDNTILYGHRDVQAQQALYRIGRDSHGNIIDRSKVVTFCDGITRQSKHNYYPSKAVDAVPYPIDWKDTKRFYHFAGYVLATANAMGIQVVWGGDFDRDFDFSDQTFFDLCHFQLA